jgi:type I restriction enzyme M protein
LLEKLFYEGHLAAICEHNDVGRALMTQVVETSLDSILAPAFERYRDGMPSGAALGELVAPLAGLLVLRWAAFMEAEREAIAAFNDAPFSRVLPSALSHVSWTESHGLPNRLTSTLANIGQRLPGFIGRYVSVVTPVVMRCAENRVSLFASLVSWVASVSFDSANGREFAASQFDHVLEKVVERQGQFGGEFTTPSNVTRLMVDLVQPKPGERVYDPCFGVGGLLVEASRKLCTAGASDSPSRWAEVRNNGVFGVEINLTSFVIGLCRVILAGVDHPGLELGDALERPLPTNRQLQGFDCILATPPWGGRLSDARARQYPVRAGGTENFFLQHVMANLRPGGRAVVALPESSLYRTGADRQVRKALLEEYRVDAVIALPEGAFAPCTALPSSLILFRRETPQSSVRFINVPKKAWSASAVGDGYVSEDGITRGRSEITIGGSISDEGSNIIPELTSLLWRDSQDSRPPTSAALESWDVDVSVLASRDYELLAKHTGAGELEAMLNRILAADPSIKLVPLNEIAEIAPGVSYGSGTTSTNPHDKGTVGLMRVGDFSDGRAKAPSMRLTREGASKLKPDQFLRAGDVALTLSGTVGKAAFIPDTVGVVGAVAAKSVAVIRGNSFMQPPFLTALLQSPAYQSWMRGHARGITVQHLSPRTLGTMPVPLPPVPMQDAVLRHLRPRGDALSLLLRFAAGGTSDPLAEWLERPRVVELLSEKIFQTDAARMLAAAGEELQALRPLRNRTAHGQEPQIPATLAHWLLVITNAGSALVGIDTIPIGAPRIAALGLAKASLTAASAVLDSDVDESQSPRPSHDSASDSAREGRSRSSSLLVARLRGLMQALDRLVYEATRDQLGPVKLVMKAQPPEVEVGAPTEIRLHCENASTSGLRALRVWTEPDVGRGTTTYLAEGAAIDVPLTIHPAVASQPLRIQAFWEAMRLEGTIEQGRESIDILVRSTRQAVLARDLGASPYIVGNPVDRDEMFYGRNTVIERIRRQLGSGANANVILLEGNRRTGKTSVLKQLQKRDALPGWIVVYCSFQDAEGDESRAGISTRNVYRLMARTIGIALFNAGVRTWPPAEPGPLNQRTFQVEFLRALDAAFAGPHPFETFEEYLASALDAASPRRLLLMLDEFDKLQEGIDTGVTSPQVPENIRHMLQHHAGLSAILTGSRRLKRLREEYWSALFGLGYRIGISALPMADARRLVTEPVVDRLTYLPAARDLLVNLCARQPFLVQSLCNRVFERAAEARERTVTVAGVNEAATEMVSENEHFRTLWDYAQTHRRRLLLALIERLADGPDPVTLVLLSAQLESEGVRVDRESQIGDDLEYLRELELIEFDKSYRGGTYRVAVPLLGMWIRTSIDYGDAAARAREEAMESHE